MAVKESGKLFHYSILVPEGKQNRVRRGLRSIGAAPAPTQTRARVTLRKHAPCNMFMQEGICSSEQTAKIYKKLQEVNSRGRINRPLMVSFTSIDTLLEYRPKFDKQNSSDVHTNQSITNLPSHQVILNPASSDSNN